ncbi:MAG: hypothetical protein GY696_19345 [Gammaproteobacteria bacterium]|nr:hypothetical protein [Gammaproteobacteria bacterium]
MSGESGLSVEKQIPIVAKLTIKDMEVQPREEEETRPETVREGEELAVQLRQTGLEDRAVLQGEGKLPPTHISSFKSLRQQYLYKQVRCTFFKS